MSDAEYAPFLKTPQRQPFPSEQVWTLRKDGRTRSGDLRDHASVGAGVQFQLHADGKMIYGRRFQSRAAALLMAEQERARYAKDGWSE